MTLHPHRTFRIVIIVVFLTADENRYGVLFTEPHSVQLADIDGDGLKDIITGKTFWSHHRQSPLWDAGAVVYWFGLQRTAAGVDWVPHRADGNAGIGRQIVVSDINRDKIPDIIVGGMQGCNVLMQSRHSVSDEAWRAAQPKPRRELRSGIEPEQAAEYMTVPEGFQVKLAAGEPDVHQPVAMSIDARGRVSKSAASHSPKAPSSFRLKSSAPTPRRTNRTWSAWTTCGSNGSVPEHLQLFAMGVASFPQPSRVIDCRLNPPPTEVALSITAPLMRQLAGRQRAS